MASFFIRLAHSAAPVIEKRSARTPAETRVASGVVVSLMLASALAIGTAAGSSYFDTAQVRRGARLYQAHCAECHGVCLERGPAVPLVGPPFDARWADSGLTADDLHYIVQTQMPQGAPGSLSSDAYLDIVAFLLHANGYPGGEGALPADARGRAARALKR